jgi:hypothetical protein
MTGEETGGYLRHHLGLAARSDTLFSDDATTLIHQTSRDYPRAVNNIALQALVAAFADDKSIVDESSTRAAIVLCVVALITYTIAVAIRAIRATSHHPRPSCRAPIPNSQFGDLLADDSGRRHRG